jgi:hypothetical protein
MDEHPNHDHHDGRSTLAAVPFVLEPLVAGELRNKVAQLDATRVWAGP